MAIHLFDAARALTGADPLSVYCDSYSPPWSWYAGPAAAAAVFRMTGDLRFSFVGNWAAPRDETGVDRLVAGDRRGRDRHLGRRGPAGPRPDALPRPRGLAGRLRRRRPHGGVPQGEGHDNLKSLAMCHAAVESAALGAPVPVTTS